MFWYKYGDPVDLSRVQVVGMNDDAYMLLIDGQRVNTVDSSTVAIAKLHGILRRDGEPPSIAINGVWRSRANEKSYTVLIGDEFVGTR